MSSLAIELFREVRPGLFRVLAGRNARAYVDVLDALELESNQRHDGMSREEALAIMVDVLEQHPDFLAEQQTLKRIWNEGTKGSFEQESLRKPQRRTWPFYD